MIDTSGSMSAKDLSACLAETRGILDATQAKVTVYTIDTKVYKKQSIYSPKEIELVGGGGTDMGVGIQAAADDHACLSIVMTDGFTPWPSSNPKGVGDVIICLISNSRWGIPQDPPSWATAVKINYDE